MKSISFFSHTFCHCLLVAIALLGSLRTHAQTYCQPNVQMSCVYGDQISRIRFAGIDHTDNVCNTDADGKKDFTAAVPAAQVVRGTSYVLTVTLLVNSSANAYVWLDFNHDGVFAASEAFNLGARTSTGDLTVTIPVPANAVVGETRLRIMNRKNNVNPGPGANDACHSMGNYRGQMKDYAVMIGAGVVLPVTLSVFEVSTAPEGASLHWRTESERNNDYFTLERSANDQHWEEVAHVSAAGNSTATRDYVFTDPKPLPDVSYYRLKQTDTDGITTFLGIVSLVTLPAVSVWPNPFTDHIAIAGTEHVTSATLYDNCWQHVAIDIATTTSGNLEIHTGALSSGVYFLVTTQGDQTSCHRLIK